MIKVGGLDAYAVGDKASKKVLVAVYDAFGYV